MVCFSYLQQATRELLQQLSRPDAAERDAAQKRHQDFDDEPAAIEGPPPSVDMSLLARNAFFQGEMLLAAATAFKGPLHRGPSAGPPRAPQPGGPAPEGSPQRGKEKEVVEKFLRVHRMQQQKMRLMSETLLVKVHLGV